jgi:hypothetical protein
MDRVSHMAAVADEIEPDAKELIGDGASDELVAAASIAISLRRIADLLVDGRLEVSGLFAGDEQLDPDRILSVGADR